MKYQIGRHTPVPLSQTTTFLPWLSIFSKDRKRPTEVSLGSVFLLPAAEPSIKSQKKQFRCGGGGS